MDLRVWHSARRRRGRGLRVCDRGGRRGAAPGDGSRLPRIAPAPVRQTGADSEGMVRGRQASLHARRTGPGRCRHSTDEVDRRRHDRLPLAGGGVVALLRQSPLRAAAGRGGDRDHFGAGALDRRKRARRRTRGDRRGTIARIRDRARACPPRRDRFRGAGGADRARPVRARRIHRTRHCRSGGGAGRDLRRPSRPCVRKGARRRLLRARGHAHAHACRPRRARGRHCRRAAAVSPLWRGRRRGCHRDLRLGRRDAAVRHPHSARLARLRHGGSRAPAADRLGRSRDGDRDLCRQCPPLRDAGGEQLAARSPRRACAAGRYRARHLPRSIADPRRDAPA